MQELVIANSHDCTEIEESEELLKETFLHGCCCGPCDL